ncbi:MAG: response regulator [Epulopiscium sp.]|nr:response regulator [Candidatus Epulonipiscium sp.]
MAGEKILIVDDKKEIAELIRDYLENEEYEVELAYNGQEALEIYKIL